MKFLMICLLSSVSLFGGMEEYFKPALNKGDNHSMGSVDFIYVINLDQRPEKYEGVIRQLEPYGIHPYRFSAVNGWELSLEAINQLGVKYEEGMPTDLWGTYYPVDGDGSPQHEVMHVVGRNYFSHCMSRGAVGITLSHLSILQDALDSGYETIWIMEDDVDVMRDPHEILDHIKTLDEKMNNPCWDVFFTDRDTKNNNGQNVLCTSYARKPNFTPENPERFRFKWYIDGVLNQVGARFGAYSMIIRRSGMEKILNFIKTHKIFLPYDLEFYQPNDIRLFAVTNDLVSTVPNSPSDNGGPNYLKKELLKWQ